MKKIIIIICAIIIMASLTGCSKGKSNATLGWKPKYNKPDLTSLTNVNDCRYYYVIDNRTGVVYLQFDGTYRSGRSGITAMFNKDGKPVTIDQIEMK